MKQTANIEVFEKLPVPRAMMVMAVPTIIPILLFMDHCFGMSGIVWTQLMADVCTVIVSYLIYFRVKKKEGF